jgi:pimeloyl-ACP methyl ester carboxylesterase
MTASASPSCLPFRSPASRAAVLHAYQTVLDSWPVPYEEIDIPTTFGNTHVIASGPPDASPLILAHPYFATSMVWQPNVAAWSRSHRVYAVDVIGEPNRSTPLHPIASRLEFVRWWMEVFDRLHIERADMVGNSNGGFLTLNQALYTPERIRKAVLIGPAATFVQMWPFYRNFFLPVMLRIRPLIQRAMRWWKQGLPSANPDWEQLFLACLLDGSSQNRVFPAVFSDAELQQIRTPILLLVGDREVVYRPQAALERADRLLPNGCAELIPSANHISGMSNPTWVNARVLQFLQA